MIVREDPKYVQVGIGREPQAVGARGDHAGHEGAVAERVVQRALARPVGALADAPEVRVVARQPCVEHRHLHAFT